jgi:hypothetical protein
MTFDEAMDAYDAANPVGTIAEAPSITLGGEAPGRPATASPAVGTADLSDPTDDRSHEPRVNMPKPARWTHIRVPVELARRIDRLTGELRAAYSAGRVEIPSAMCERIPAWYTIANALDEQEARRARSARPRKKSSV